ncbi:MAG: hypothetical protein ABL961_03505 [Vicinamibacterales bacterium]
MTPVRTRGISFAGVRVTVESTGEVGDALVDLLFRDMSDLEPERPACQHFVVRDLGAGLGVQVSSDGARFHEGADIGDAALKLQEAVTMALAAKCTSGLVLHAAAAARSGRALILPGRSGSGKTTLSAYLLARGFTYLSDEMVFLESGTLLVEGLPRPLNVKAHGLHLVANPAVASAAWASLSGPAATLMQLPVDMAGAAGSAASQTRPALAALVFPRFQPDAPATCIPLTPAQAGLRLMSALLNARNLEGHGFPAVTALAREVPAYELQFGDVREAVPLVMALP